MEKTRDVARTTSSINVPTPNEPNVKVSDWDTRPIIYERD